MHKNRRKNKGTVYIHYGHDCFDKNYLSETIANQNKTHRWIDDFKPVGLWASPINARLSWKKFCISEDFCIDRLASCFRFKLSKQAKILHIDSLDEALAKCLIKINISNMLPFADYHFDTTKVQSEYDGIELHISNDYDHLHFNNVFYTWDVDSICIWNPNVIIPVKKHKQLYK